MKKACEARIANPTLTLLAALKIGGFTFPQDHPTCEDCDDDGVRLRQRKNQLSVSAREAYLSVSWAQYEYIAYAIEPETVQLEAARPGVRRFVSFALAYLSPLHISNTCRAIFLIPILWPTLVISFLSLQLIAPHPTGEARQRGQ